MAFLEDIRITGSLGNLSFYPMRGVNKIVVRTKGGPSKEQIKNSPKFATPRLFMSEFGGCSKMGKEVRLMMHPVRKLSDYNFSGFINKALKIVQKQDSTGELGQRSIALSKHPHLLAGFQLNNATTFDSVIRTPLRCTINRATLSARVDIPALLRDINFHPNNRHARFRFEATLGIVPDFTFNSKERAYEPSHWYTAMFAPASVKSPWYPALKGSPATSLEINLTNQVPADEGYSLMLTVGVRYGSPMEDDVVQEVKRAGVGKVVAVAGQKDGEGIMPGSKRVVETVIVDEVERAVTDRQSAAACVYGWQSSACVRSAEANLVIESTRVEIKSSSEKSEELVVTNEIPAQVTRESSEDLNQLPDAGLEGDAAFAFQEHDDGGGDGNDQEQRPDVDETEQQFGSTLQSG
jgi:hypothetical protein